MPQREMAHVVEPKERTWGEVGDLSEITIANNQVLIAIYERPEKTKSGIYLPETNLDEDKYQSKVGLVVKKGPTAFVDNANEGWFVDFEVNIGDWIIFRPSDGWAIQINKKSCRVLEDTCVRGKILNPDSVW